MTYLEVEKQLVLFLAELLELEPDKTVFAGELPIGIDEGMTISLQEGQPATHSQTNIFTASICSFSYCRRSIRQQAFTIASALPVFGKSGLLSVCMHETTPLKFSVSGEKEGALHSFSLSLTVKFI